jgi:hypothetical protein
MEEKLMADVPAYFPRTAQEIDAWRRSKRALTLVDEADLAHKELLQSEPDYTYLVTAFRNEDAVEGNLRWDTWRAAEMLREYANADKEVGRFPLLAAAKMKDLHRAYLWAKKRAGMTREDMANRAQRAGGAA